MQLIQFYPLRLKIYRYQALCFVLGTVTYKTQLMSHGSYNLVEGAGDHNLDSRI